MTSRHPHSRKAAAIAFGVALTVLLAWIAAAFSDIKTHTFEPAPRGGDMPGLRVYVPRDWTPRTWLARAGPALRHDLISECIWAGSTLGSSPETEPNRTRTFVSVGWPLPAMQWTAYEENLYTTSVPWKSMTVTDAWQGGLPQWGSHRSLATGDERRFPIRPAWVGFAVDVALFAFASWWTMEWFTRLRTARRAAKGQCVACGYDRTGLTEGASACPECGGSAPAKPPAARIPA